MFLLLKSLTPIDRSIIRIAMCELMYRDDIPKKVILNEAINITKKYPDFVLKCSLDFNNKINGIFAFFLYEEEVNDSFKRTNFALSFGKTVLQVYIAKLE